MKKRNNSNNARKSLVVKYKSLNYATFEKYKINIINKILRLNKNMIVTF